MKRWMTFALALVLAVGAAAAGGAVGRKVEPADEMPALRGILQAGLRDAKWGIVCEVTSYRSADTGKVVGKTGVGSVFVVEKFQAGGRGYDYVGRFRNRPTEGPFLIPAKCLIGLTGSFELLSPHQQQAYAAYYRLRAERERIKAEVNRRNGEKSPYYKDAVAAKAKYDELKEETLKLEGRLRSASETDAAGVRERLARLKGEVSVQDARVRELSGRHRAWKDAHPAGQADVEKDPKYAEIGAEMNDYAQIVPGLAI